MKGFWNVFKELVGNLILSVKRICVPFDRINSEQSALMNPKRFPIWIGEKTYTHCKIACLDVLAQCTCWFRSHVYNLLIASRERLQFNVHLNTQKAAQKERAVENTCFLIQGIVKISIRGLGDPLSNYSLTLWFTCYLKHEWLSEAQAHNENRSKLLSKLQF